MYTSTSVYLHIYIYDLCARRPTRAHIHLHGLEHEPRGIGPDDLNEFQREIRVLGSYLGPKST